MDTSVSLSLGSKPLVKDQSQPIILGVSTMPSAEDNKKSKKDKVKKSGVRTKFLIESLRNDYYSLREENGRLRQLVTDNLAEDAAKSVLAECFDLNAPKAKVTNLDDLAAGVEDEEAEAGDDSDVGF